MKTTTILLQTPKPREYTYGRDKQKIQTHMYGSTGKKIEHPAATYFGQQGRHLIKRIITQTRRLVK